MTDQDDKQEQLPQELIDELKLADRSFTMITSRVDREVSALARVQFGDRTTSRRIKSRRFAAFAVAASVLLAVLVTQTRDPQIDPGTDVYADLDASGQIDIADVLYLARRNQDQSEVDKFAMKVVALEDLRETS